MGDTKRILVVDDEPDILELVRYNLEKEGYTVSTADGGKRCLELVKRFVPDLLVLDIMMPDMDGLEVCKALRSDKDTASLPIIMLTAKTDEIDMVLGLELGADDYVLKPFSTKVLLARAKSLLRRAERSRDNDSDTIIRRSGFIVDVAGHEVSFNGDILALTASEFAILRLLLSHPGRVFTRLQIMRTARDDGYISTERAIDVQILNLRRKLGDGAAHIKTVRGVGYKFDG